MPDGEANSDGSSTGFAGMIMNAPGALAAMATVAVSYGAYKVIGSITDYLRAPQPFDSTHLPSWENLGSHRAIVHAVRLSTELVQGPLFQAPAENVFNGWDIISTSLIDTRLIKTRNQSSGERYIGLVSTVGFILEVPPQNILGTHPRDVFFSNQAPGCKLKDNFMSGKSDFTYNHLRYPHYHRMMAPDELMFQSINNWFSSGYSEVLVVGRPGVNIYKNYPVTSNLKVTAIVVIPRVANGEPSADEITAACLLKKVNDHLPVLVVMDGEFIVLME